MSGLLCFAAFSICLPFLPETRFFRVQDDEDEAAPRRRQVASNEPVKTSAGNTTLPPPHPHRPSEEETDNAKRERESLLTPTPPSLCNKIRSVVCDRRVIMATMLFSIFGFACVALDETIPLWAATKQMYGGIGFSTNQVWCT